MRKVLAPGTEKIPDSSPTDQPLPSRRTTINFDDDLDEEEADPLRPRLSMPLDEDEDGDSELAAAPRLSSVPLEDENITQRSVEMPRNAFQMLARNRLSRGSFGSIRMSDRFADLNELGLGDVTDEGDTTGLRPEFDDGDDLGAADDEDIDIEEDEIAG
jgi:hypothetical protein